MDGMGGGDDLQRLDEVSLHSDENDHGANGANDLASEHVFPVVGTITAFAECKQH